VEQKCPPEPKRVDNSNHIVWWTSWHSGGGVASRMVNGWSKVGYKSGNSCSQRAPFVTNIQLNSVLHNGTQSSLSRGCMWS